MRIIAAFFVVMIHASGLGSFSAVVYNSVARFSVPVFVIISGYYLLTCPPKGTALGKKGLRLFLLMLLWSAVYYGYGLYSGSLTFTGARGLFTYLLTEPVHLWYLYAAIALYLFTPLLYIFCEHAGRRVFLYALTLSFLMGSVVVILLRSGCFPLLTVIVDRAKLPCTLGFLFLFLLGGYLRRYGIPSAVHRRVLYLLGLAGVAVTVLCTWTLPAWGLPQDLLLSFFAPNVLVASAAFFVFVQQAVRHAHPQAPRVQAILHEMAGCTLGIYFSIRCFCRFSLLRWSHPFSPYLPVSGSSSGRYWPTFWPFFWCSWCEGYRDFGGWFKVPAWNSRCLSRDFEKGAGVAGPFAG